VKMVREYSDRGQVMADKQLAKTRWLKLKCNLTAIWLSES
jgi:hypothetical protein